MAKNSIILHYNHLKPFLKISNESAGILFKAIVKFQFEGEVPKFEDEHTQFIFEIFKEQIEYDSQKYTAFCLKQAENGKKGGRPKNPENPTVILESQKSLSESKSESVPESYKTSIHDTEFDYEYRYYIEQMSTNIKDVL